MFRIITLEREYGCGCAGIAKQLAERLHWKLWDHLLTEEIAKQANVDCGTVEKREEKIDSTFYRLAKVFWRGSYEHGMPMAEPQTFDAVSHNAQNDGRPQPTWAFQTQSPQ